MLWTEGLSRPVFYHKLLAVPPPNMGASSSTISQSRDDLYGNDSNNCREEVRDGLFYRHWPTAVTPPRAIAFVFHGLHEHSGRYSDFALGLVSRGIAVYSFDYTGHGRTPSYLTHPGDVGTAGWNGLVTAAAALVEREVGAYGSDAPCPPVLVFGHSLGSMVAFLAIDILCQRATAAASKLADAKGGGAGGDDDVIKRRALVATACVPTAVAMSGLPLRPGPAVAAPFRLECLNCVPLHCGNVARGLGACMEVLAPRAPNSPVKVSCLTHDDARLAIVARDFYHHKGDVCNRTGHQSLRACKAVEDAARRGDWGLVGGGNTTSSSTTSASNALATATKGDGSEMAVTSSQPGSMNIVAVGSGSKTGRFPLLLVHGSEDTLAYPSAPERLLTALAQNSGNGADTSGGNSGDITAKAETNAQLKVYPGLFHELLQEAPADREKVANDIYAFFDASLRTAASSEAGKE